MILAKLISIIPASNFCEILIICLAQLFYFFFRKSNVGCQWSGTHHRIEFKIIQGRLRNFLLHRKNPGEIGQLDIFCRFCSLKHPSQKINIRILNLLICCLIPNQDIPLVNNDNKFPPGPIFNSGKSVRQSFYF